MVADKLKDRIEQSGLKPAKIASELDISVEALRLKLNETTDFKMSEARKLQKLLGLTNEDIISIFFT